MTQPSLPFNPELEWKKRILDDHARGRNGLLLEFLRGELIRKYGRNRWLCADQARAVMRENGIVLRNNNALGALFRAPGWETDGVRIHSRTPGSHANPLLRWRYMGSVSYDRSR